MLDLNEQSLPMFTNALRFTRHTSMLNCRETRYLRTAAPTGSGLGNDMWFVENDRWAGVGRRMKFDIAVYCLGVSPLTRAPGVG
jgi:hypothetical protein